MGSPSGLKLRLTSAISLAKQLNTYCREGRWKSSLQELRGAQANRVASDLVVFNIALRALSIGAGRWQTASALCSATNAAMPFERALDTYSWNTLANTFSKECLWTYTLSILQQLRRSHNADLVTYNTAISSLKGQGVLWPRASSLLNLACVAKLQVDIVTCTSVAACAQEVAEGTDVWWDSLTHLSVARRVGLTQSIFLLSTCMTCMSRVASACLSLTTHC